MKRRQRIRVCESGRVSLSPHSFFLCRGRRTVARPVLALARSAHSQPVRHHRDHASLSSLLQIGRASLRFPFRHMPDAAPPTPPPSSDDHAACSGVLTEFVRCLRRSPCMQVQAGRERETRRERARPLSRLSNALSSSPIDRPPIHPSDPGQVRDPLRRRRPGVRRPAGHPFSLQAGDRGRPVPHPGQQARPVERRREGH